MKNWFTLSEAAEVSGLGNTTIRTKIKTGDLKAVKRPSKHGPRWEIPREALLDFVEEQPHLEVEGGDLGGVRGVTLNPRGSEASESPGLSEGIGEVSEPSEAFETPRRPSEGSEALQVIQQALLVAERAREDRLTAFLERDALVEENDRLRRQLCEVQVLLGTERRLLAENSESLIEKEAALKQQRAIREQKAEEARKAREEAEAEAHQARAEALEVAARLKDAEDQAEARRLEAEAVKAQLEEAQSALESREKEMKKPFWKKWFSKSS